MRLSEVSGIKVGDRAALQERTNVVALIEDDLHFEKSTLANIPS